MLPQRVFLGVDLFNQHTKPYWSDEVKCVHKKGRTLRNKWIENGRLWGVNHESYRQYKTAKREFKNTQQDALERYQKTSYDDINKAAECDLRLFWKMVKNFKPKTSKIYRDIIQNGVVCDNPISITNGFME